MNTNKTTKATKLTTPMPTMPRMAKVKASRECACGCGQLTKSTWTSGHDGRAMGWALRVTRGVMTIDEIPANERQGCDIMLARIAREDAATGTNGQ